MTMPIEEKIDRIMRPYSMSLEQLKQYKSDKVCRDCKAPYELSIHSPNKIVMTEDGERVPRFSGSGDYNMLKKSLPFEGVDFEDGYYYGGKICKDIIDTSKEYKAAFRKEVERYNQNACKCSWPVM
ncbi:MAG: hypothetical protein CL833_07420 [Crocinitomicaceae bacterium]|nr:hypothetical protein [Crocinitomicaceae bacterium]